MTIEPVIGKVVSTVPQTKTTTKGPAESKEKVTHSVTGDDTLSITSAAQDIKSDSATPIVNETRVAEIKAALLNGSYKIDNERLAAKIFDFESKLPDST
jgi:negative regulator of flagellin synthesis FlgM